MESLKVRDYMAKKPLVLSSSLFLEQAVAQLFSAQMVGAPVVGDNHQLVGFVSEQDLLASMLKNAYHCDGHTQVADVMRTEVISVTPDTSVIALAEQMLTHQPKIYPVVVAEQVVGVIHRRDVLQALMRHLRHCQ